MPYKRFLPLLVACAAFPAAHARATPETGYLATRLQVYGMGSYAQPRYLGSNDGYGYVIGGSAGFTVRHLHRFEPALDIRYTHASSSTIGESTFNGGLRMAYNVGRFHPYGDFLIGKGNITLKQYDNQTNNSFVPTYGGGLDYSLSRSWGVRGEYMRQSWRLSERDTRFYPTMTSVGIRYQFHFHSKYGPE